MIRRRIWRQGNSTVVTLSPTHLKHLGVSVGQYLDMELYYFPKVDDFVLCLHRPDVEPKLGPFKLVDNFVDNSVDK